MFIFCSSAYALSYFQSLGPSDYQFEYSFIQDHGVGSRALARRNNEIHACSITAISRDSKTWAESDSAPVRMVDGEGWKLKCFEQEWRCRVVFNGQQETGRQRRTSQRICRSGCVHSICKHLSRPTLVHNPLPEIHNRPGHGDSGGAPTRQGISVHHCQF